MGPFKGDDAGSAQAPERSCKEQLINAAYRLFELRQLRTDHFRSSIFGEPGWDILLLLYFERPAHSSLSASDICAKVGAPPTTTVRWLHYLKNEKLIIDLAYSSDPRLSQIVLSEQALELLSTYLEASLAKGLEAPLQRSISPHGKG